MSEAIVVEHYAAWLNAMVAHIDVHELSGGEVDALCGLSDGAYSKITAKEMKKEFRAGAYQMFAMINNLGFDMVLIPNPAKMQKMLERRTKRKRPKLTHALGSYGRHGGAARDVLIRIRADDLRIRAANGGIAAAKKMNAKQRQARARKAALIRWNDVKAAAAQAVNAK